MVGLVAMLWVSNRWCCGAITKGFPCERSLS